MIKKILFLFLALVLYLIGHILLNFFNIFGFCFGNIYIVSGVNECWSKYTSASWAMMHFGSFLTPVAILLLFSSKRIFSVWWKYFAVWALPLFAILIALHPDVGDAFNPVQPGKSAFAVWLGTIFLLVSGLIIFFKNKQK